MRTYLNRCASAKKKSLHRDLIGFCGDDNVPSVPDKTLLRKMYKAQNTRMFCEKHYEKDPKLLRSTAVVGEHVDQLDRWNEGVVVQDPVKEGHYRYRGQGGLNPQQEWLLFLTKIHHNVP